MNWEWLANNRDKVNVRYRYDKFLLYLDEILLQSIQILFEKAGTEGVRDLRGEISRMKEHAPDLEQEPTRIFFRKMEQLLKMT